MNAAGAAQPAWGIERWNKGNATAQRSVIIEYQWKKKHLTERGEQGVNGIIIPVTEAINAATEQRAQRAAGTAHRMNKRRIQAPMLTGTKNAEKRRNG